MSERSPWRSRCVGVVVVVHAVVDNYVVEKGQS